MSDTGWPSRRRHAQAFGPRLRELFDALLRGLESAGYLTQRNQDSIVIVAGVDCQFHVYVAHDLVSLAENWCTVIVTLEDLLRDVRLEAVVFGPQIGKSYPMPEIALHRVSDRDDEAIRKMLAAVDPDNLLSQIKACLERAMPPRNPKAWSPGERKLDC